MKGSRTQRITAKDIGGGRIRVPRETKRLFPQERSRVMVDLLGQRLDCRWDPKFGPDQERSGVIAVGRRTLAGLVDPDEVLYAYPAADAVEIRREAEVPEQTSRSGDPPLSDLEKAAADFAAERDWAQFHSPKELAIGLTLEVAEVVELMQWKMGAELDKHLAANREALEDELADVLWYTLLLAHYQGIDLAKAFERKLAKNAAKYPVDKARNSAAKYTEFE